MSAIHAATMMAPPPSSGGGLHVDTTPPQPPQPNLSALGAALHQTTISGPSEALALSRKSPKKRERTDSLKRMVEPPASQRARRQSDGADGNAFEDEAYEDDGDMAANLQIEMDSTADDELSDTSNSEPVIRLPVKDRTGSAIAGVPRQHLISNAVKTAPPAKEKSNPRRWSKHEDESLRLAVERSGERNWKAIAEQVPGRNHTQCLQRWTKVLKPGLIKGHWDPEEDAKLRELVAEGKRNWGQVASLIPGRTSKQCRERWCNHLDPNINKGSYTEEEDRIILEMQAKLGNRWSIIAQQLKGRTEDAVKIRWKSLMRGKKAGGKDGKDGSESSSPKGHDGGNPASDSSAASTSVAKPDEKPARSKPARTPTKQRTRAASPVAKSAEQKNSSTAHTTKLSPTTSIRTSAAPLIVQPLELKDTPGMPTYVQNMNDLAAVSIHNFKMSQNYPPGVQMPPHNGATTVPASLGTSAGIISTSSIPPTSSAHSSMSFANPPMYSMNAFPQPMNPTHRSYMMPPPYSVQQGMQLPPNYVMPTSGIPGMSIQPVTMSNVVTSGGPIPSSVPVYGGYTGGGMSIPMTARSTAIPTVPNYPNQSISVAQSSAYPSGMAVSAAGYGGQHLIGHVATANLGPTLDALVPIPLSIGTQQPIATAKLDTPREEWGSSQTPRSHLILTEGHTSAYELFHQQRLRLMLQEREKGMSLTSAPSPGQAMLTKELRANKERQKRQEMLQKGWKSAVEAMMGLNNDTPSLDDGDGLMEKVGLSNLDPTDDELMDTAVELSLPPADESLAEDPTLPDQD